MPPKNTENRANQKFIMRNIANSSGDVPENIGEVIEDAMRKSVSPSPNALIEAMDRVLKKSRQQSA